MNEEIKTPKAPETEKPEKKGLSARTIFTIIIVALMILLPLFIFFWKQYEIQNLQIKYMETITRVFTWTAHSEILDSNAVQLEKYMNDLVKTAGINSISIVGTDGIVVLSTNKKFEGSAYSEASAGELSLINKVVSQKAEKGEMVSKCPITDIDKRMGTMIISYTPNK